MKTLSHLLLAAFLCAFVAGCSAEQGSTNPNTLPEGGGAEAGAHDEAEAEAGGDEGDGNPGE
ncbi:MAG: hypothetical protein QGG71_01790 [Pirellulaceae bacterium]|jgi:hypothetical protein|nr:hypothetical protein [Pirellulaceae bacterium]